MTTDTRSIQLSQATDAAYRAWAEAISLALDAIGITKTADTGQVDWTTNPARPTISTTPHYEIRYIDDSMHGTAPVYMRLEYGCDSNIARPAIAISWGTGSDGAGNLTGVWSSRAVYNGGANVWTLPSDMHSCSWDGGFMLVAGHNNSGTMISFVLSFDRTALSDGTLTGEGGIWGVMFASSSGISINWQRYSVSGSVSVSLASGDPVYALPAGMSNESFQVGSDIYLGLGHVWMPGEGIRYLTGTLCTGATDFSANSTFTADGYDGSHTWRALRGSSKTLSATSQHGGCICMRWE